VKAWRVAGEGEDSQEVPTTLVAAVSARLLETGGRVRVAVDGRDGVGKTMLADALAALLVAEGIEVVRSGIDHWHHPARIRYRRGRDSPEGYYLDSFDPERLRLALLDPFGRDGDGRCRLAGFDHRRDAVVDQKPTAVGRSAVLLFDGVFLLRPELRAYWDLAIYLHVDPAVALERAVRRDADGMGGAIRARERYLRRYLPGQVLYHADARPEEGADVVVDMTDPSHPRLMRSAR